MNPYARKALQGELDRLRGAGEGVRNDTAWRVGFNLGGLISGGELNDHEVRVALYQIADGWPNSSKTRDTISRALEAGKAHPRGRPAQRKPSRGEAEMTDEELLTEMNDRPEVIVEGGRLPVIVDRCQEVLRKNHREFRIYERGGLLVQPAVQAADDNASNAVWRRAGTVTLKVLGVPALRDILTRAMCFQKPLKPKQDGPEPLDCPKLVAEVLLARAGDLRVPQLLGIVEAPILRPDGSTLSDPGYDEATALYLFSSAPWSPVPERSTLEDARAAVSVLLEPFAQFPFVTEGDRAVLVAAILTTLQRRLLFSAPMFAFDAPVQGSGKSLLADCVSLIGTGHPPTCVVAPVRNDDEWRKLLTTVLLSGDSVIAIDNVIKPLDSAALAKVLTQPTHDDRILATNSRASTPTNVTFLCTGNNLTFSGDMPTRVVGSRINPAVECPEERQFAIPDLRAHIVRNRRALVQAALTILRAHFVAGRPVMGLKPFGRFEQWSREIRAAVVWAGLPDPCITRDRIVAENPERSAAAALLIAWFHRFGHEPVSLARIVNEAEAHPDLKSVLLEVAAGDKGAIAPRRLGWWCRKQKDRVRSGFCLTQAAGTDVSSGALWAVRPTESRTHTESFAIPAHGRTGSQHPVNGNREALKMTPFDSVTPCAADSDREIF
jgi:hypothetical protein